MEISTMSKPVAWLDAFGKPHKNYADALVDFDPANQPEPLYRASDVAVLVEALKHISAHCHWGASHCGATADKALASTGIASDMVLVPREPTPVMVNAGRLTLKGASDFPEGEQARCVYESMVAAAQ